MNSSWLNLNRKRIVVAALLLASAGGVYWAVTIFWKHRDYRAAQEAAEKRDFDTADRHIRAYLQRHPDDSSAWLLASGIARRQGKLANARDYVDTYSRLAGANAQVKLERRLLKLHDGNIDDGEALLTDDPAHKTEILEALIEGCIKRLGIGLHHEINETGRGEISMADYDRAHQAVDQWLAACTNRADQVQGFVWRGTLFGLARKNAKALDAFRAALEVDPDHRAARQHLGLLLAADNPREASAHLKRVRDQDGSNIKVTYALAAAHRSLGEYEHAGKLLDELLQAQPAEPALLVERALVAMDERRPQQAEQLLQRAVSAAPSHGQANLLYSQCLQQLGRTEDAKKYHDKFLEIQAQTKRDQDARKK